MTITPNQCKAARDLLDWKQTDLQKKSKLGRETIGNFERGIGNQTIRTLADIRRAFEEAGIKFVDDKEKLGVVILKKQINKK